MEVKGILKIVLEQVEKPFSVLNYQQKERVVERLRRAISTEKSDIRKAEWKTIVDCSKESFKDTKLLNHASILDDCRWGSISNHHKVVYIGSKHKRIKIRGVIGGLAQKRRRYGADPLYLFNTYNSENNITKTHGITTDELTDFIPYHGNTEIGNVAEDILADNPVEIEERTKRVFAEKNTQDFKIGDIVTVKFQTWKYSITRKGNRIRPEDKFEVLKINRRTVKVINVHNTIKSQKPFTIYQRMN